MRAPRKIAGFTLVEIMIVVVIVGLLAAMAAPAYRMVRRNSNVRLLTNDFRKYADAIIIYNLEYGDWPETAAMSVIPDGMVGMMPPGYTEGSTLSGGFAWDYDSEELSLTGSSADDQLMIRVDQVLDDGDLNTGAFTKSGNDYVFKLSLN